MHRGVGLSAGGTCIVASLEQSSASTQTPEARGLQMSQVLQPGSLSL